MRTENIIGPSGRLRKGLERQAYCANETELVDRFVADFDIQATAARKILNQGHIPREGVRKAIAQAAGISESYWMFGVDKYCEDLFIDLMEKTAEAVVTAFIDKGSSLSSYPPRLLPHLMRTAYRDAAGRDGVVDPAYVREIVDITLDLAGHDSSAA